jgi:Protein of unknown function (DUF2848)
MSVLRFHLRTDGAVSELDVPISELVIAGWTGRDQASLNAHIQELAALGVPVPGATPIFYRVSASLLTTSNSIQVMGRDSTGEVEFVLIDDGQRLLVGLGSDHTDRKAETLGITLSKQMCPKVLAPEIWEFSGVEPHWDELFLRSYAVTGGQRTLYQQGSVAAMRHPKDLIERYGEGFRAGTAMFGGTFPVTGGIRWADEFQMELEDPVLKRAITHSYAIEALPVLG